LPLQRARPFQVADYNADVGTLIVRIAKGGQMRHVTLTEEASAFVDRLAVGRAPQDPLLRRDDGRAWKRAEQVRPMREACARAGIVPAVGFHVQRHTHGSLLAMRAVPMAVIARQLGRADTRRPRSTTRILRPTMSPTRYGRLFRDWRTKADRRCDQSPPQRRQSINLRMDHHARLLKNYFPPRV
jgi:hypothetical protein